MLLQFITKEDTVGKIETAARTAMEAGVNWIEICAPESVSDDELKALIEKLRPDLAEKDVVLILGNRYEQAKEWQCDGVHIYSTDKPLSAVRVAVDAWPIIGVSVTDRASAEALRGLDIDYLFFESNATPEALENIREIAKYLEDNMIETPLVAGGDITEGDILNHVDAGAAAIATSNLETLGTLLHFTRNLTQKNV
ncbi:MAG: thiamine phosphate synthase [Lachnospiraceae bacterium]|nr:thiamine phosphate synthase [Prevotella sp.]MCM1074457.1 thiamine phosphate synthase [Ruminococcus sp.]MCM1221436.1 thiamine phosphate synthase [Lachnospiraceae bacterium]